MVLFFTSIPLARSAEIAIAPFQIAAGETVTQPVNVNLSEADGDMFEYQGFQLDLTLPVGISVDYDQTKMLGALSGFEISFNDKINRLVAYTKGDAVSTATELMGIAFKASDDIKAGIYPIDISKVIFSTPLGKDKILDDYSTTVTVIQPVLEGFYLYIPDFPIYRGGNYSATLNLEHGDLEMVDYRGLQFDLLNVPSYISIDLEKTVVNALGNGYSIKARKLGDSSYRFLVYAGGETASTILDTDLITIYFTASKEAPIGDVVVNNEKQILASNLGQDWTLGTSSTTITILPESPVPVESVTITPSTVLLPAGGNAYQLTATVMPENATDKTLSWSSSDPTVATVDQDGKVTPLVAGYTTITATANDGSEKFGTCEVTVYDIEVIPETMTLKVEDVANLTANILPEGFTNPEGWNIQWTSSDPTVVSVDQTGKITALKVGENIIITATFGEVSATCVINVVTNLVPVTSITVSPEYLYIPVGGAAQTLTAEVMPENATDKRVSWTIAPLSGVATVNQNGEVAPVAPGYAKVTATTTDDSDLSDSSDIVVYNITLNKIQTSLITGESEELTATTLPADFMPAGWNVVWTSSNSSVVSVDNNGKITAVGAGTATITATFGEASATCIVNVTAPNQISIYIDNFSLYAGDSYNAQVKVSPEIESTPYSAFQFDITVPEQLSITSKETTLEGFGNVTIVPLTQQGDNVFRVTCYGSTSNPSTSTQLMTITFTADKDAAAGTYDMPINEGYLSTPKGADIVATPSTTKVTIKRVTYRVAVDPKNLEIQEGTHGKIGATVTVTPADKADDYTIVWTSSNPDVATVDQDGNVTAVSEGKCVITATVIVNGEEVASDSSDITVTKTPVKPTLTVVPEEAELKVGKTLGLDYIINPTEAGENANVRWTSSDPSVATVDPETGQVTAVGEGECTITATAYDEDGKEIASGDAKITVTAIEYTVKIDPDDFDLKEGESQHLDVVIEPEYEGDYTIVWESDNEDVATVDEEGNVTGVGEGEAHITGKVYDEDGNLIGEAEATVKVTPATPEPEYTVKIEPDDFDLKEGESQHLDVVIEPEYEGDYTIVWESDNEDVAIVDEDGNVTGVGEGEAHITGKVYDEDGNLIGEAEATVTVTPATPEPEYTVKIEPSEVELEEGESTQLEVVIEPEYEGGYIVKWESSDEGVATVDEEGNVTGVGEGECTITGTVYDEEGNEIGKATATVVVKGETPEVPETPEIPVTPGIVGWYGNDNGTYVSEIKIREGNQLGLFVNEAMGGYPAGWNYLWYDPEENVLGDEHENWTTAELYGAAANSGDNQAISVNVYNVYVYDYDNEDNIYWETTLPTAKVNVYKRPQIPTQLLRKGQSATGGQDTPETGTSCTFVIMMTPLSNQQILDLGYSYVYGYTDQSGEMHKLDDTERRYTHTTSDIYWNTGYKFWAYSKWTYPDGSVVTSGLRYLDGGEDPDFDASDFSGNRTIQTSSEDVLIGIYSLDGSFVGMDAQRLQPGIYIIRNTKSSQKVIIF